MRHAFGILLLGVGVCGVPSAASASPITINFGTDGFGPVGNTNNSTFTDSGPGTQNTGLVVTGYYLKITEDHPSGVWTLANLFQRNDAPDDVGFGVCNPVEGSNCVGNGDINELDNAGQRELIRLKLPVGYQWVSVGVSSLDGCESGVLSANSTGTPVLTPGAAGGPAIQSFIANDCSHPNSSANQEFTIPNANLGSPYLFFEPYDPSGATNNDFLVRDAVIQSISRDGDPPPVPEPASLVLLGSGLALAVRKRWASK